MIKNPKLFDVRAIERNLKHKTITHKEVADYLIALPDVSAKRITLGELDDRRAGTRAETAPAPERTIVSTRVAVEPTSERTDSSEWD